MMVIPAVVIQSLGLKDRRQPFSLVVPLVVEHHKDPEPAGGADGLADGVLQPRAFGQGKTCVGDGLAGVVVACWGWWGVGVWGSEER